MKHLNRAVARRIVVVLTLAFAAACGPADPPPAPPSDVPARGPAAVDAARLTAAENEPGQWLSHGRTYWEQRFSPLTQIDTATVGRLGLSWFADFDTNRGQEATPIAVDGVLYVSTAWSKVYAFDAVSGRPLWKFDPEVDGQRAVYTCCDFVNRGVAIWNGKVYVGTIDGRLIALDAASGVPVWDIDTVDLEWPYTITGAPRVVKGKVIIGNSGAEFGVRGYVSAYDAESGELAWRFFTVPGDPSLGFENETMEMAATTWSGEWWKMGGGGTVWDSIAYEPELDLLYIGVGNGSPWNHTLRSNGVGDNLFLASIVALDPDDGTYRWHYQTSPAESWDHTATQQMTIADLAIDGRTRRVLMQAPKNGFFYVLDAANGELISARPFTEIAWATHVDLTTGRPVETPEARYDATGRPFLSKQSPNGAHTWHSMSYSRDTGLVYLPVHQADHVFAADTNFGPRALTTNVGTGADPNLPTDRGALARVNDALVESAKGRLIAWDPIAQREVWRVERAGPANGGALSTAGGLVFQGTGTGRFTALDARSGDELWSADTQTGVIAAPVSYEVNGTQYVAVAVGTGGSWGAGGRRLNAKGNDLPNRSRLLVYALDAGAELPPPTGPAVRTLALPPATADAATVAQGAGAYGTYCARCHGADAENFGISPDLRYSPMLTSAEAFAGVVLEGLRAPAGMASFAEVLDVSAAEAIRAYVVERAHAAAQ